MSKFKLTSVLVLLGILVLGTSVTLWDLSKESPKSSPIAAKAEAKQAKKQKKGKNSKQSKQSKKKQKKEGGTTDPTLNPPAPKLPSCIQIDGGDFAGRYDYLNDRNTTYYRSGNTCVIGESDYWIVTDCTPWKTGSLYFNAFSARNPIDASWRGHGEYTDASLNVSACE